jgi:hypothetical protein
MTLREGGGGGRTRFRQAGPRGWLHNVNTQAVHVHQRLRAADRWYIQQHAQVTRNAKP